jgi:hypothetical protein
LEISAIIIGLLESMSTIDLLTRVNTVIKKYEKYDPQKEKGATDIPNHDHWLKLYTSLQDDLNDALKVFFHIQTWTRMLQKCPWNPTSHIARYSTTLLLAITAIAGYAACRTRNLGHGSDFGPSKMG